VTRHRKQGTLERLELLEPGRLVGMTKAGEACIWNPDSGWVGHPTAPTALVAGPAALEAGNDPLLQPPHVAWGTTRGQVVVAFVRLHGMEELVVDWGRKVRSRQRWLTPEGKLQREDLWEEEWVRGVRRPVQLTHVEHASPVAPYTVTWAWQSSPSSNAEPLDAAP
jgi:hypothetical protein